MGFIAAAGALFNNLGDITGSDKAAEGAGRAAMAREDQLRENLGVAEGQLQSQQGFRASINQQGRAGIQAASSPEELNALTQSFATQERQLAKQQQLFDSIDPAIMEASSQALQLLRGEDAKALAPIRQQRDQERQALVNNLREQMGPGAETSTAGIQALNQFDQQTTQTLSSAQQGSLGQLFGIASTGAQNRSALNQGAGQLAQIGQAFGQRAGRISGANFNAIQGNIGANNAFAGAQRNVLGARSELAGGTGAAFTQQTLQGQGQMQAFGQVASLAGALGGAAIGAQGGG